ncbi:hypothetical protein BVC93_14195 [Mycobacterium sp. MS1601]|uniref:dihydrodipicolinate synthase family protein n=1 Tax=Mycobacterium sp. MS1601 TaxID=1936029 RepID=UPI0009792D4A|nr:dihydrodipicolinate synthase family protein [Mycobacterium sp. MS1601]AQA03374.1 hypothetical protein BVC93_14195 [Mycobacterium sp. MS1601]
MTEFRGTYIPTITPFTPDGSLDVAGIHDNVDWWIAEGLHGLIPGGSAGEFLQLDDDEFRLMASETVNAARRRVPVILGITADSTKLAVERAEFAAEIGADGVMVAPPYYSQVDQDELTEHFRCVARASHLPVMVYNNPFTTGVELTPEFLADLAAAEETIRYVKDTSFNVQRVLEITALSGGSMKVFAGLLGYESMAVGAAGWVSIPGLMAPSQCARLADAALSGDLATAAEMHAAIFPLMKMEEDTNKFVQMPKAALTLMNRPAGAPRAPRRPLQGEELDRLRSILDQLGLLPR